MTWLTNHWGVFHIAFNIGEHGMFYLTFKAETYFISYFSLPFSNDLQRVVHLHWLKERDFQISAITFFDIDQIKE